MNKKAFLLVDSLICIVITVCISCLCIYTYNQLDNFQYTYKMYYEDINNNYTNIYKGLNECVKCSIEEETEGIEEDL